MATGSMINHFMGNSKQPTPEVGMGVTRLGWSDRHPYTIVEVVSLNKIVVQEDNAKRLDKNGMSESQEYEYTPNTESRKVTITLRKNGRWVEQGEPLNANSFLLGYREKYHDYSF